MDETLHTKTHEQLCTALFVAMNHLKYIQDISFGMIHDKAKEALRCIHQELNRELNEEDLPF